MVRSQNKEVLYGIYNDEELLLSAVRQANAEHIEIWDVFSPFPIHGLDPLLGLKESRLHISGFVYGLIGTLTAFLGMTWITTMDWPLIIGGKPHWAVPAFVPIIFEVTVLFSAIGMVVTFYTICGLAPGVTNPTLDDRITDDKFCLAFDANHIDTDKARALFEATGAEEVNVKKI